MKSFKIFLIGIFIFIALFLLSPLMINIVNSLELSSPSDFSAEVYNQYIKLSWKDKNQYSSYTIIEKSVDYSGFTPIATLSKNISTYKDYSISNGHVYTYRAKTYYRSSNSTYTEETEVIVLYPDSFEITLSLSDHVDLDWSYPELFLLKYPEYETIVERRESTSGKWTEIAVLPASQLSYRDSSIKPDTLYYYRIRTKFGKESFSSYIPNSSGISTRTAFPLTSPLWGYALSSNRIVLEWDISNLIDDGRVILEKEDSAGNFKSIFSSRTVSRYVDTGVTDGEVYRYRLCMQSKRGLKSEYTDVIEVAAQAVQTPLNLEVWAISSDKTALAWEYPFEVETGFEIWRKASGLWELVALVPKNSDSYVDSSVEEGQGYNYKVRAVRGENAYSSFSREINVINRYPAKPKPLVYIAQNGFMMLFSSEHIPENTAYILEYRTNENSPWSDYTRFEKGILIGYVGYSDKSEYYFRLRAESNGLFSYSPEIHFFGSPPDPVLNLYAPVIGYDRVTLNWDDVSIREEGYHIYRTANGKREFIGFTEKDEETFTDHSPLAGVSSVYEIIGFNASGQSASRYLTVAVPNIPAYKDIEAYGWAKSAIYALKGLGVLDNTGDEYFYPQKTMTLGQTLHIILNCFKVPSDTHQVLAFSDLSPVHPYYKDIMVAASIGIIHPDSSGRIYPDKPVTRENLLIILNNTLNYLGIPLSPYPLESIMNYPDYSRIPIETAPIIASFVGDSIVSGKNGYLSLSDNSTRAETVTIIHRTLKKYLPENNNN